MKKIRIIQERTQKIGRTVMLKILHPTVKTDQWHMVRLDTEILLREGGTLRLGKNVYTCRGVTFYAYGGRLTIGSGVTFNRNDIVACHEEITIGNDCAFGPNVAVYDHDHIFSENGFSMEEFRTSPVRIDDHCWIGANVTILRGTHIGPCCVIGAGAVVRGEIPAHSLVTGSRELIIQPIRRK